ncbi:MAG TPA: class I SAM-dependent methyltransferase [Candidatus Pelethocola excrementipullorum]|nr:class I SAM-dependent methyltransferase [Candidatus Pelethocola excrementipullorum]
MEKGKFWTLTEQSHPGGESLSLWLLDEAKSMGGLPAGGRILDVGCGQGGSLGLLKDYGYQTEGIDLSPCSDQKEQGLIEGDFLTYPLEKDTYDAILMECTLCLLDETQAFRQIRRCLKMGGLLLISDIYQKEMGMPDYENFSFRKMSAKCCEQEWKSYLAYWIWNYGADDHPSCLCEKKEDWKKLGYYAGIYQYVN